MAGGETGFDAAAAALHEEAAAAQETELADEEAADEPAGEHPLVFYPLQLSIDHGNTSVGMVGSLSSRGSLSCLLSGQLICSA